ncbi:MAG: hypothetical protein B6D56_02575 [Candidatus Omnitrophica bacterium 4484_70.1]|nr:MAG: hypothetical protein B6D56_02575 [Candidatus Omnitrophica bacterium 4484_70.1]
MIQRLIILGVLKRGPSTGYDIKKFIQKELRVFSRTEEIKSVYYPLKKMEEEGLIKKRARKTNHLKKYIYYITPQGEREFFRLCRETLLSQKRPFIEWDIVLYFLPFLDKKEVLPFLRLRLRFLRKVRGWLKKKREELKQAPKNLVLLINHHLKLVGAEKEFLKNLLVIIRNEEVV